MRTGILLGLCAFAASACVDLSVSMGTPGWMKSRQGPVYVLVKTNPEGATISFPDGTVCESPCRVGVIEPLEMSVARTGYHPIKMTLTRMTASPTLLEMEPVLKDSDIEELEVPDL